MATINDASGLALHACPNYVAGNFVRLIFRFSIRAILCATTYSFPQNLGFLNAIISDFTSYSGVCYRAITGVVAWLWHGIQNHHGDFDYLFSRHGSLL